MADNAEGLRSDERVMDAPTQNITLSCTPEYNSYKYNEKVDMWSLVSLKGPCQDEDENDDSKRAPIDLVAVIDKSGSMGGKKLELVKRTLEFVLTQLTEKDRLSVVTYDTNVYVDFKLRNMVKENKDFASNKINEIIIGSSTNLSGGLIKGLCEMIDRTTKNEVASVLLFTDGLANQGIRHKVGIIAAMEDPKRFDGPSAQSPQFSQQPMQMQEWLLNVFGRNSNQAQQVPNMQILPVMNQDPDEIQPEIQTKKPSEPGKKADATVYTFGFGDDHDADMLTAISDAGNGMYYYIENEDKIAESFAHCLGGLMSTVAQGIQVEITLEDGVAFKKIHTVKPYEQINNKSVKINMGDLQSEEKRDVVLELTLDAVPQPYSTTPQKILNAKTDYFNVLTSSMCTEEAILSVFRPETTEDNREKNTDRDVNKQKVRIRMTSAMLKATADADNDQFGAASSGLRAEIGALRNASNMFGDDTFGHWADDLEECELNVKSKSVYERKGVKLHKNITQQYQVQRSSNLDSNAYVTKGKIDKRAAAKDFLSKK